MVVEPSTATTVAVTVMVVNPRIATATTVAAAAIAAGVQQKISRLCFVGLIMIDQF